MNKINSIDKSKYIIKPFSTINLIALGMAWYLDNGFWSILLDTLLGSVYISYKITQIIVKYYGAS
jgi:hypothetical protein